MYERDRPGSPPEASRESPEEVSPRVSEDEALAWLVADTNKPAPRDITVSMRITVAERERVDRAAEALGVTTSAYVRSRVLGPGPDVGGWRAVYKLILELAEAAERGEDPVRLTQDFEAAFRRVALTVFPDSD